MITTPPIQFIKNELTGKNLLRKSTTVADLKDIFTDEKARATMPQNETVYEVDAYLPVPEGTLGGLFFGVTRLLPGKVGSEYYMTRGHFHALSDRAEYYWGISGSGILILMDRKRNVWAEKMRAGSLDYIPAHTAHRVANTDNEVLSFGACWPSDAGHDYEEIAKNGFASRLLSVNGMPQLVKTEGQ